LYRFNEVLGQLFEVLGMQFLTNVVITDIAAAFEISFTIFLHWVYNAVKLK